MLRFVSAAGELQILPRSSPQSLSFILNCNGSKQSYCVISFKNCVVLIIVLRYYCAVVACVAVTLTAVLCCFAIAFFLRCAATGCVGLCCVLF